MYQDDLIEIMQSNRVLLNLYNVNDIKGRVRLRWKDKKEDEEGEVEVKNEERNDDVNVLVRSADHDVGILTTSILSIPANDFSSSSSSSSSSSLHRNKNKTE
jgi:hypothetical protein